MSEIQPTGCCVRAADPADGPAVWQVALGQRCRPHPRDAVHLAMLLVPMTLTATLGTISFSGSDGSAIASFWPAAALQIVFSIWFGLPGALAGMIGPMLGNGLVGSSPLLFVPANLVQSVLPGVVFRGLKLDPRLRTRRDWAGLILLCCVVSNALGAALGVGENAVRTAAVGGADQAGAWWINYGRWFLGNLAPSVVLAPALLKAASPIIVRGPHFYRCLLGRTEGRRAHGRHFGHLRDMPMIVKLILLAMVAGVLPLCILAGVTVWDTVVKANRLAAMANRDIAMQVRDEVDRHELLLRDYRNVLGRSDLSDRQRRDQLRTWERDEQAFAGLEVVDRATLQERLNPAYRRPLSLLPAMFFDAPAADGSGRDGVWAAVALKTTPGKWLIGQCLWRQGSFSGRILGDIQHLIVQDTTGKELYRNGIADLMTWQPGNRRLNDGKGIITHAGRKWHVAEARSERMGTRFWTLIGVREGKVAVLSRVNNTVPILVNLAIFGAMILSTWMAGRIGGRVLRIAEQVECCGGRPGDLHVPVDGADELGYLSETLNRMSADMAAYIRELQVTTAEKERLAHALDLARQLQQAVLPARPPEVAGYELAASCQPAREVGGDFYDYFRTPRDQVAVMIGDAAGKGLKAAMFMTETRGIARAAALGGLEPHGILHAANRAMISDRSQASQDFITLFCALLDPCEHRLQYASAGHCQPVAAQNGEIDRLELDGLPVAVLDDGGYSLHNHGLAPGQSLVLYTDGVTEAMNRSRELFGMDRLEEVIRSRRSDSAEELLQAIIAAVQDFAGPTPQSDDLTVLVLRRLERP